MMFLAVILSCMIAGSLACSDAHCKDRALAIELMEVNFLPNKDELRTLCPKVMRFLECQKDFMECPGQSLEELSNSSSKLEAAMAKGMLAGISLLRDICDEDSSFHADYTSSVSCSRENINGAARNCTDTIAKPILDFFDQTYADADENDINEEAHIESRCLRDAFEFACIVNNIGDACGDIAERTALSAAERLKDVLGLYSCKQLSNAADLKSRFLDFLELEEQRRSNIQGVFDLFKRR